MENKVTDIFSCGQKIHQIYESFVDLLGKDPIQPDDMIESAIRFDASLLEYVNDKTYERCMLAVKTCGEALELVPLEHRDKKMCLAAIESNCFALAHVPSDLLDRDMYLSAVRNNPTSIWIVPEEMIDNRFYETVAQWGYLEYIPQDHITCQMCLKAGFKRKSSYSYVPEDLLEEVGKELAKHNPPDIEFLPMDELRKEEFYAMAQEEYGWPCVKIPEHENSSHINSLLCR